MNIKGDLILIMLLLVFLTISVVRLYPSNNDTFSVSAIEGVGAIGIYEDEDCISPVYSIDWGVLTPGEDKDISVYVRNEGRKTFFLILDTTAWEPKKADKSLIFSYSPSDDEERLLKTGQVIQITPKLMVPMEIEISHFSFDIVFKLWSPDIDGNGDVDCRDLSKVAKAYPSVEGDLLYDESCDLDSNGKIALMDLVLIERCFGRTDF